MIRSLANEFRLGGPGAAHYFASWKSTFLRRAMLRDLKTFYEFFSFISD